MRRYSSNKDWNTQIRRVVRLGWVFKRGGKHARLTHPNGFPTLIVPCSPSDCRGLQNFIRLLKA